ncbi:hypothetical protein LTR08_000366 [Meristemomyces frigidus]|nr:hypothetical protein LTR08_000366 [Meristemomyces frigidus]
MGCDNSTLSSDSTICLARTSLRRALPVADSIDYANWRRSEIHRGGVFGKYRDRENFIAAILLIMSRNGQRDLNDLTFLLYYPQANSPDAQYHAAFIVKDGDVVRHSLVSEHTEPSEHDAFMQMKAEVEKQLSLMLLGEPYMQEGVGGPTEHLNLNSPLPPYSAAKLKRTWKHGSQYEVPSDEDDARVDG